MSNPSPAVESPAPPLAPPVPPPTPVPAALPRPSRLARWLAALGGLAWFLGVLGGAKVVSPTRIDWMAREDWAGHLFGWLFFRNAPWGLPLSATPNHFYPRGTSVALTDGNPLVAVLLKPFAFLLPADFQYTGLWLALCFALMGYFGARLVECVSPRPVHQLLGGLLLALSPPLAARFGHPTLCAHWLLVALVWLNLKDSPDAASARRALFVALGLNAVGAGTHPYLVAMMIPLTLALCARLALGRVLGWGRAALAAVGVVAVDMGLFALLGYFGGASLGADGFGEFSADLATLANPRGGSRWLPELASTGRQGEGFGFLGVGIFLLLGLGLIAAVPRFRALKVVPWRRVAPLAVVALGMAVYALSWRVTWLGVQVADLRPLYEPLSRLTSTFRASGRFVWPLVYVLMAGAVLLWLWLWRERPWVGAAALGVAVVLQAADARGERSPLHWPASFDRLKATEWAALKDGGYRHLALFPPHIQWVCPYDARLVNALGYVAYRTGLSFNSGNFSRLPPLVEEDCRAVMRPGGMDTDTAYVVGREQVPAFRRAGARCGVLEEVAVCVAGQRMDAFARALERQPLR